MSSEAAKKAYPDAENEAGSLSRSNVPVQRAAFDAGAVEALKQAAAQVDTGSAEWVRLMNMAGFWKTGQ